MNQNEPFFPESLYKRYRKTENFRSINDLGNYVRKES